MATSGDFRRQLTRIGRCSAQHRVSPSQCPRATGRVRDCLVRGRRCRTATASGSQAHSSSAAASAPGWWCGGARTRSAARVRATGSARQQRQAPWGRSGSSSCCSFRPRSSRSCMVGGIGGCTRLACEPITLNWSRRLKVLKHLGENLTWLPDSSRLGRRFIAKVRRSPWAACARWTWRLVPLEPSRGEWHGSWPSRPSSPRIETATQAALERDVARWATCALGGLPHHGTSVASARLRRDLAPIYRLLACRRGRHRDAHLLADDLVGSALGDEYPELAICEICGRAIEWPNGMPDFPRRKRERNPRG